MYSYKLNKSFLCFTVPQNVRRLSDLSINSNKTPFQFPEFVDGAPYLYFKQTETFNKTSQTFLTVSCLINHIMHLATADYHG